MNIDNATPRDLTKNFPREMWEEICLEMPRCDLPKMGSVSDYSITPRLIFGLSYDWQTFVRSTDILETLSMDLSYASTN